MSRGIKFQPKKQRVENLKHVVFVVKMDLKRLTETSLNIVKASKYAKNGSLYTVRFNKHATSLTTLEGRYMSKKAAVLKL